MTEVRHLFAKTLVRVTAWALAVAACGLTIAGCAPPELMQAAPADAASEETGVVEEASFGQVADVIRGSCAATPSCHGDSGFTNFSVEGNSQASDEQVRDAIEDVTTNAGIDIVAPGDAEASAIYLRLVETGARKMPPPGQPGLSDEEIEIVRVWIEQGAAYE